MLLKTSSFVLVMVLSTITKAGLLGDLLLCPWLWHTQTSMMGRWCLFPGLKLISEQAIRPGGLNQFFLFIIIDRSLAATNAQIELKIIRKAVKFLLSTLIRYLFISLYKRRKNGPSKKVSKSILLKGFVEENIDVGLSR